MISVFDLFKIGIGPSSSHTVGPMRAATAFIDAVRTGGLLPRVRRIGVVLSGSLAWTGRGHGSDRAVVAGLNGERPDSVDPAAMERLLLRATKERFVEIDGRRIEFDAATDLVFDTVTVTLAHPNTLCFTAYAADGAVLLQQRWCSVGGGFIALEHEVGAPVADIAAVPFAFSSAAELLEIAAREQLSIAALVLRNECALRPLDQLEAHLDRVADTMMACIDRGIGSASANLPGGLNVRRRAAALHERLRAAKAHAVRAPHEIMDYVSLYAIAVNEENAAGGRVVTAPTNGAAGVIPAVLRYYRDHVDGADIAGIRTFLLTATSIGALCKLNASISGAEVGCQGEVGSACAMAAAGLVAVLGGSNAQIENAAEIAMEHHLGMTCDPIGGLVQIPCIERNAFGAVKAINAASLAMHGDGTHHVSLDQVIATMRQTGADMQSKYKETSQGGLAVNVPEC
jgi:L-serine dehydratase